MSKHEIKVEFSDNTALENLIEKAYFEEGQLGKILGKNNFLQIEESDVVNYVIFKDLDGATIKITNEMIDGCIRFMIEEIDGNIKLYPISIYCIKEEGKYIFY